MKTMLWKELRENFKWALLALLFLLAAEFYALTVNREANLSSYSDLTLCSSAFEMVTAFGCSAVGLGLALVQIMPELRRDQWAALLHRPVPRSTIFFGKAWAGLLLYLAATVVPFFACVYYVATPGQFASPLVPGLLIPGLSDLFLGPMFYFAAILLCLHRGPWWGSRGAIGLSVIPILLQHLTGGLPFVVPIVATMVYLAAAWGAMLSNGGMENRPRWGRATLAVTVLVGAETALLAFVWMLQVLPQRSTSQLPSYMIYTQFEVADDGQIFFERQNGEGATDLTDLHGNVVTDPRYSGNRAQQRFCQLEPFTLAIGGLHGDQPFYWLRSPRNFQNYVRKCSNGGYGDKEIWYLLVADNYFVGYDKLSHRKIGICDATGFQPPGTKPVPFAGKLEQSIFSEGFFWYGSHLYGIDFPERKMTRFPVESGPVYGASTPVDYTRPKPAFVAAALNGGIRLFTPEGKPIVDIAYPHDPFIWSYLSIGSNEAGDKVYLQSETSFVFGRPRAFVSPPPVFLDVFDLHGELLQAYSKPGDPDNAAPPTWSKKTADYLSPFLPALVGTLHANMVPADSTLDFSSLDGEGPPRPALNLPWNDLVILFLLDVALGITAFVCARAVGFSLGRSLGWAFLVSCFGLAGLAAFRFASDWPKRVRCPQCGTYRPLGKPTCPSCHATWAQPDSLGTEIFDLAPFARVGVAEGP